MAYLFDTSAISEALRVRPDAAYLEWLRGVPREDQYTSTIVVGELFAGAHGAGNPDRWLTRIEQDVLPEVTVLPFDLECAKVYGQMRAHLKAQGTPIGDAETMIAAIALRFSLTLVTANVRHFEKVPGLAPRPVRTAAR